MTVDEGPEALLELARRVVERARAGEQVEAFALRKVETEVEALRGEVDALSSAETRGVGVRVIVEGRQGYASTAVVNEVGLGEALTEARSNAVVATPDDANRLPTSQAPAEVGELVDSRLLDTPVEEKIRLALELERVATDDPRVRGVDIAKYGDVYVRAALASTEGLALTAARTDAWAFVMPLASDHDETQTGLGVTIGRSADELDVEAAGREGAQRAVRLLGATKPDSRRTAVVFDPYATASFLGVLARTLSAEAVLKGRSLFADRLGDQVAGEDLTLLDDGLLADGPATAPFDGEGVPQHTTALIQGGTLRSFLHNTWSALRFGEGASSTGNASRGSFTSSPGIAPTNLYLEPGPLDPARVLATAGEAVYVQDVAGLHSGANPISGDFSVGVTGLAVRGGELAEPFREATVASTIVELLRAITVVGDDLRFLPFHGALGGSTVLVAEMSVSGR
ncbi:MAG TPA: TldD/PmbA family protein [Nitriliruptorales bacterium]|nr:TldD/PmbA family protein [Nitriliruptorales bacterium]